MLNELHSRPLGTKKKNKTARSVHNDQLLTNITLALTSSLVDPVPNFNVRVKVEILLSGTMQHSLRTADAFSVAASLRPEMRLLFAGYMQHRARIVFLI